MPEIAPLLQACPNCAALLDVSEEEPFAQIHCPMCGTSMRARKQFNNFSLIEPLGAGGMGAVYKAIDLNLNRPVALKLLRKEYSANQEFIGKFETEARITASVTHPNVVKVFSFGSDHGIFYIAMELVDKGSLDDLMELQKRVAEVQVLQVGIQVAQGLQAAFQRGLIHRDVKPGNILFADAQNAKIVDFGLALLMEQEAEARGEVWGTPYYVAPEKLNHEPEDFRSDIYSLGGTLFHAVAGRPPFEAENASLVALKHLKSQAVSLQAFAPDVSSATAYVINRTLHKDPEKRYQSYAELIDHLNYAKSQLMEAAAKPRQAKARVILESERHQRLMGLLTIGLIVLVLGVGSLLYVFRERFLGTGEQPTPGTNSSPLQLPAAAGVAGEKYQQGRELLINGDFAGAEASFRGAAMQPNVPPPLLNWILLHHGMTLVLTHQLPQSREVFRKIAEAPPGPATSEEEKALASFFVDTARVMVTDASVPSATTRTLDKATMQAFALLLFGAKNWELAEFEQAAPLFAEFGTSKPEEPFDWILEYRPLAKKFLHDFDAYKKLLDRLSAPPASNDPVAALATLEAVKGELQTGSRISDKIAQIEVDIRKRSEQVLAEREKEMTEQQEAATREQKESDGLEAIIRQLPPLYAGYKYDQAVSLLNTAVATTPKVMEKRDRVLRHAEWLARFKKTLINDINTVGFPSPVSKKTGAVVNGQVKKASETQVSVVTPYGVIPVTWLDLSPRSMVAMAEHFRKLPANTATSNDRLWSMGIFAIATGQDKEGRPMLAKAAETNSDYKPFLNDFPETGSAP